MKRVLDQGVLFLYCFAAICFAQPDIWCVFVSLIALLYICVSCLTESRWIKVGAAALFFGLSFVFPKLLFFTPLVVYGIQEICNYAVTAVFVAAFAGVTVYCDTVSAVLDAPALCDIVAGSIVAWILQYRTGEYALLDERFRRTRDDGEERNLLLKEKNQSILEKQDYEIYTATLKERNRIAREIHDNVGHMLSRSILMVGAMKAVCRDGTLQGSLNQLEETLNAAMTSVRESVHGLHDEAVNLKAVLEGVVKEYTFCQVQLEYDMGYDVPKELRYGFIAIVKEALHNVTKHSDATRVRVTAREHPGMYQLIVEDNGSAAGGRTEDFGRNSGIGLSNMRDRVDAFGGNLEIRTERGWRVYITVPKRTEDVT